MERFYFTFGTDPAFPFGEGSYVIVLAADINKAVDKFIARHPSRPGQEGIANCAFYYSEQQFNSFRNKYYKGIAPAEVITD